MELRFEQRSLNVIELKNFDAFILNTRFYIFTTTYFDSIYVFYSNKLRTNSNIWQYTTSRNIYYREMFWMIVFMLQNSLLYRTVLQSLHNESYPALY